MAERGASLSGETARIQMGKLAVPDIAVLVLRGICTCTPCTGIRGIRSFGQCITIPIRAAFCQARRCRHSIATIQIGTQDPDLKNSLVRTQLLHVLPQLLRPRLPPRTSTYSAPVDSQLRSSSSACLRAARSFTKPVGQVQVIHVNQNPGTETDSLPSMPAPSARYGHGACMGNSTAIDSIQTPPANVGTAFPHASKYRRRLPRYPELEQLAPRQ
ncbi:hypothetical protein HDV57DRAFT_185466 [Trichoderma longibrachiatum]